MPFLLSGICEAPFELADAPGKCGRGQSRHAGVVWRQSPCIHRASTQQRAPSQRSSKQTSRMGTTTGPWDVRTLVGPGGATGNPGSWERFARPAGIPVYIVICKADLSVTQPKQLRGAEEACWAHNPEVKGSKPFGAIFFLWTRALSFAPFVPLSRRCIRLFCLRGGLQPPLPPLVSSVCWAIGTRPRG